MPVSSQQLSEEFATATLVCRFQHLEIHILDGRSAPLSLQEIGRIREREFRAVGAGRGGDIDLDRHDTDAPVYSQLVAWDPTEQEIVAMYRFLLCREALAAPLDEGGRIPMRTAQLFDFSSDFMTDVLPYAFELGRSVVNRRARRAIAGQFAVWAGLGALVCEFTELRYFFGNISLYANYPSEARAALVWYLNRHHAGSGVSVRPELRPDPAALPLDRIAALFSGADRDADWQRVHELHQEQHCAVPPILLSYRGVTDQMAYFETAVDRDFGGAMESAILIPFAGLNEKTRKRFIDPYRRVAEGYFERRELPTAAH